jgi:hypothetical protein
MEAAIWGLIDDAKSETIWPDSYIDAEALLESVPLATDEFLAAKLHLRNAQNYLRDKEFGAACFELRQVRSQIDAL